MDFDVFISYHTKSSLHITEAVCNALENKKIKCWYAPRNIAGNYAKSIVEAIGRCKIFLLILNREASYSEDVLNEINLAVERVRKGEDISIIPFHISEDEISLDAKYYLSRMHWVDAINPPLEKRIQELVSRISYILNQNTDTNFEESKEEPSLKSTYSASIGNLIGRKDELKILEENLKKYGKVFVQGMGGIGKSELVKAYINEHQKDYTTIVFAVYENSLIDTVIKEEYFKISPFQRKIDENGKQEDRIMYFQRKMEMIHQLSNEKTLIIIDNFDVEEDPNLKDLLKGNYHLIITTRNDFKAYRLPVMTIEPITKMEDLLEIFQENYRIPMNPEDLSTIEKMIELVGRHTLTIQLLASVMQEMRIKPKKMYQDLKEYGITEKIHGEVIHDLQNYDSIYQCLSMLFRISSLTEEEKKILKYLTVFPLAGISFDDFMDLCEIETGETINHLIKKSFILHNYITDTISLHPLIANLVERELLFSMEEMKPLIHQLRQKNNWNMVASEREKYVPICLAIYQKSPNFDISVAFDFVYLSNYLRDANLWEPTEQILKRAIRLFEQDKEKYLPELIQTYGAMGYIYYIRDNSPAKNRDYTLKIIELVEGKKEYLRKYADALRALAVESIEEQNYEEAKKQIEKSYELFQKAEDTTPSEMGACLAAYAKVWKGLKEYEKAFKYADQSYQCLFQHYQEENLDTSSLTKLKGEIQIELGNYKEGIAFLEKALELRLKYCSKNNIMVLRIKDSLADAYLQAKEYAKAKGKLEELSHSLKENFFQVDGWIASIQKKIDLSNSKVS